MTLVIETETLPLMLDSDGVVRVGGTRVTLDTIVAAFEDGATAEEIVQHYPSLQLEDTYFAIGYYLRHRPDVEAYLSYRRQLAETVRKENMTRFDQRGVRERLMARRAKAERPE